MQISEIEEIVDKLIYSVKSDELLKDLRFVKDYKEQNIESPLTDYLAVVSINSMSRSSAFLGDAVANGLKSEKYNAEIFIKIYAPNFKEGQGLTSISSLLLNSIKKADKENLIEEISIEPVVFEENINAVYRICKFKISFFLCEEVTV
ncbi:MAG: hypothetical protein J1E56_01190 [Ruminococcus sp.]|nr:hypothetical protein [Ruminococcus sp.]